jgi:hypothetical protein
MILVAYQQGQANPAGPVYSRQQICTGTGFRPLTRFVDIGPSDHT